MKTEADVELAVLECGAESDAVAAEGFADAEHAIAEADAALSRSAGEGL